MIKNESLYDEKIINKSYDNEIIQKAKALRKSIAESITTTSEVRWNDISLQGGMFEKILERTPFTDTENILQFNFLITQLATSSILQNKSYSIIDKIALYASVVEIGSREFIIPETNKVVTHLVAAKENGYFFTPTSVAIRMVLESIDSVADPKLVLDPSMGVGVFLAYHALFNKKLEKIIGIEIDTSTSILATNLIKYVLDYVGNNRIKYEIINSDFFDYFEENRDIKADVVIMNPPYGNLKFLKSALTDKTTKANLDSDTTIQLEKRLREEKLSYSKRLRSYFYNFGITKGVLEYSKLFLVASFELINENGSITSITPMSWLGDEASFEFRKKIIGSGYLRTLWFIPERAKIFKGVNQPTVISIISKKSNSVIKIAEEVLKIEDYSEKVFVANLEQVKKISSTNLKFPKANSDDLKILSHFAQFTQIKDINYIHNVRGELDITKYRDYITPNKTKTRLIRGDHIKGRELLEAHLSKKDSFVKVNGFLREIQNSKKMKYFYESRIAIPQCTYLNKDKRLEAAIIPEKNIIGNSCNFISLYNTEDRESKQFYYWIFLNSSVAEWQFRAFSYNNHVSNNELAELHCIPFEDLGIELKLLLMSNQSLQNQEKDWYLLDSLIAKSLQIPKSDYKRILVSLNYDKIEKYMEVYNEINGEK
ncbi:N-6 DNA methylase [Streptococcus anginosus]|uniref:N-6 DNA methylase n=1 Tax=Streptococcus anginosus TaxID=1328 RepID=UPI0022E7F882|nr:N-6 DNA methylase [Streptococcus anginosus]